MSQPADRVDALVGRDRTPARPRGHSRRPAVRVALTSLGAIVVASMMWATPAAPASGPTVPATPIKHVVIIVQENQSFDHVFGKFCTAVAAGLITRAGYD